MDENSPARKRSGNLGNVVATAIAAPLATAALDQAAKLVRAMADRRGQPRSGGEAVYRYLDKMRVIGETALSMDDESPGDDRQRIVADSGALRDALHEELADLRLSSTARGSDVLDAAQRAVADADRLAAALYKWALRPADASQAHAVNEALQAIGASQDALLSCIGSARRGRPKKGETTGP
jgi:hypothetical protein